MAESKSIENDSNVDSTIGTEGSLGYHDQSAGVSKPHPSPKWIEIGNYTPKAHKTKKVKIFLDEHSTKDRYTENERRFQIQFWIPTIQSDKNVLWNEWENLRYNKYMLHINANSDDKYWEHLQIFHLLVAGRLHLAETITWKKSTLWLDGDLCSVIFFLSKAAYDPRKVLNSISRKLKKLKNSQNNQLNQNMNKFVEFSLKQLDAETYCGDNWINGLRRLSYANVEIKYSGNNKKTIKAITNTVIHSETIIYQNFVDSSNRFIIDIDQQNVPLLISSAETYKLELNKWEVETRNSGELPDDWDNYKEIHIIISRVSSDEQNPQSDLANLLIICSAAGIKVDAILSVKTPATICYEYVRMILMLLGKVRDVLFEHNTKYKICIHARGSDRISRGDHGYMPYLYWTHELGDIGFVTFHFHSPPWFLSPSLASDHKSIRHQSKSNMPPEKKYADKLAACPGLYDEKLKLLLSLIAKGNYEDTVAKEMFLYPNTLGIYRPDEQSINHNDNSHNTNNNNNNNKIYRSDEQSINHNDNSHNTNNNNNNNKIYRSDEQSINH
eukprot:127969_1